MRYFTLSILLFWLTASQSQNPNIHFYPVDNQNVLAAGMTRLANGNLALLYETHCYTPGSIVIEGCPIHKGIFYTNSEGDTLWSKNFSSGYGWLQSNVFEQADQSLTIFQNRGGVSGSCLGLIVSGAFGGGLNRPVVHRLSQSGALLSSQQFDPNECSLKMTFGLSHGNDLKVMVADYEQVVLINQPKISWFYKLAANNSLVSLNTFANDYFGNAKAAAIDNSFFMCAYLDETNTFRLAKIDYQGNIAWSKTYSGLFIPGHLNQLTKLSNGDFLLLSVRASPNPGGQLARFNDNGDYLWHKDFGGLYECAATEKPNGALLFAQSVRKTNGVDYNILIRQLSPSGDSLSGKSYDLGNVNSFPSSILALDNTEFLLYGSTSCCSVDTITAPSQAFLLKDDFATVGANEPATEKLIVYPNPVTDVIYLKGNANRGRLDIRNANGAVVSSNEIQNESINIGHLLPGFYIAELLMPDGQKVTGKIIKM